MTCECPSSEIKAIFDAGRPTMRFIATGEPVYMVDPGPPKVTITDVVIGEYFIDRVFAAKAKTGDEFNF